MSRTLGGDKRVKVDPDRAKLIRRKRIREGKTIGQIAEEEKLNPATVSAICNFKGVYKE